MRMSGMKSKGTNSAIGGGRWGRIARKYSSSSSSSGIGSGIAGAVSRLRDRRAKAQSKDTLGKPKKYKSNGKEYADGLPKAERAKQQNALSGTL